VNESLVDGEKEPMEWIKNQRISAVKWLVGRWFVIEKMAVISLFIGFLL